MRECMRVCVLVVCVRACMRISIDDLVFLVLSFCTVNNNNDNFYILGNQAMSCINRKGLIHLRVSKHSSCQSQSQ